MHLLLTPTAFHLFGWNITLSQVLGLVTRAQAWVDDEEHDIPPAMNHFVPLPPSHNDDENTDSEDGEAVFLDSVEAEVESGAAPPPSESPTLPRPAI
jgi:hypothetical protein